MGSVLARTFIHVPGVGPATERALWQAGVVSWRHFMRFPPAVPAILRRPEITNLIQGSISALTSGDASFFARHLPRSEWWRTYPNFRSKIVFLDIETTGLSSYYDEVTVVGLYDGIRVRTLLAGHDLPSLSEALAPYDIVITFNGTLFDLPFLRSKFRDLRFPPLHLDLRFLLRRIGYGGSLKLIEKKLRIERAREVRALDGLAAPVLWARYLNGDVQALEQLIKYNIADVTALQSLVGFVHQQLAARLLPNRRALRRRRIHSPRRVLVQVRRLSTSEISLRVERTHQVLQLGSVPRPMVTVDMLLARTPNPQKTPKVVGIDLRASEDRPTGWAFLSGDTATTTVLYRDEQLLQTTTRLEPDVVSIDAPLTLPRGRCCVSDSCPCRRHGIVRECERTLWSRAVRVYPCLLPSMQRLTLRGMRLAKSFREAGFTVIESYPGAAQDIMRIPRKRASLDDLRRGLAAFGLRGSCLDRQTSHDELDAITSAIVAYFYLTGDVEPLGNDDEGYLIIPRLYRPTRS